MSYLTSKGKEEGVIMRPLEEKRLQSGKIKDSKLVFKLNWKN